MPENDITELQTLDIYQLTESQYAELAESSELDPNAIYMTPASNAVTSVNGQIPSANGNVDLSSEFNAKQDKLTAGLGISIEENSEGNTVISSTSTSTTYSFSSSYNAITVTPSEGTAMTLTLMPKRATATLAVASWSGTAAPYSYAVTVTGMTADSHPVVSLNNSSSIAASTANNRALAWSKVFCAVTAANTITFYATEKPTVALPIQIVGY